MKPIVRNIETNCFYEFLGENRFRNLITGKEGVVSDEIAKKVFRFNLEATQIIYDYPEVENLIKTLGLKFQIS